MSALVEDGAKPDVAVKGFKTGSTRRYAIQPDSPARLVSMIAERRVNDTYLAREQAFIAAVALEITSNPNRVLSIVIGGQGMTKTCQHHRAVRRMTRRLAKRCDRFTSATESFESHPTKKRPQWKVGGRAALGSTRTTVLGLSPGVSIVAGRS